MPRDRYGRFLRRSHGIRKSSKGKRRIRRGRGLLYQRF